MSDDRLALWVEMQQRVWHGDTQSKARTIVLKRKGDDAKIFECPVDGENVAGILRTALAMQGQELAKGSHAFILIALDEAGVQLGELPQTIRGTNSEATSAATEQLAMANAHAKALSNLDSTNQILLRANEQLSAKISELLEDKFVVVEKLVEQMSSNFTQQLELLKFERTQKRYDDITEAMTPVAAIVIEQVVRKYLKTDPAIGALLARKDAAEHEPPKEPADAASPSSIEPRPEPVQGNLAAGSKGNAGNNLPSSGKQVAPAKRTTTQNRGTRQ